KRTSQEKGAMMPIGPGLDGFTFSQTSIKANAPAAAVVYTLYNPRGFIYFGESEDIARRLTQHLDDLDSCINRMGATFFAFELLPAQGARVARQAQLIRLYRTPCNQAVS